MIQIYDCLKCTNISKKACMFTVFFVPTVTALRIFRVLIAIASQLLLGTLVYLQ